MNWDRTEGNWMQFKGKIKQQWGELTDNEIDGIAGRRGQLAGKLQEYYGVSNEQAEKQLAEWEKRRQQKCADATGAGFSTRAVLCFLDQGARMAITEHTAGFLATAVALMFCAATFAQAANLDQHTVNQMSTALPPPPISKEQYKTNADRIQVEYKAAHASCDSMSGNSKDICVAEAKAMEKIAKSELEARYRNTANARYVARVSKAEADYSVAKEKCDDLSGNARNVCVMEAKVELTRGTADAKSDRQVFEARSRSAEKVADARKDAAQDKRDAEYALAKEKCDAFSGPVKDRCIGDAKARLGKP